MIDHGTPSLRQCAAQLARGDPAFEEKLAQMLRDAGLDMGASSSSSPVLNQSVLDQPEEEFGCKGSGIGDRILDCGDSVFVVGAATGEPRASVRSLRWRRVPLNASAREEQARCLLLWRAKFYSGRGRSSLAPPSARTPRAQVPSHLVPKARLGEAVWRDRAFSRAKVDRFALRTQHVNLRIVGQAE